MNLNNLTNKRILVVGDIMLDKHIHGHVSRISPEAPVPVLKAEKETYNPGGAANLANNLASLGAETFLAGVTGKDQAREILFNELKKRNIDHSCIITSNKPTTQKIRGIAHQHLFRIDYEDSMLISNEEEQKLLSLVKEKINQIDAIILSDYSKGTLTENLVRSLITLAKNNNKLITADCKPININFYKNVDILKPNKKEAIEMTLTNNIEEAGKILSEKLNSNIIITRGSEGCTLFEKNQEPYNIPTTQKDFYDVAGAGDTFLAALTLSLSSGYDLKDSTKIANQAASLVVLKPGVSIISKEELERSFSNNIKVVPKVWGQEEWLVNNEKYCGKKMLIKQNYYCSYHMHKEKEETFYILDGELELIHEGKYKVVKKGETLHVKPLEYHSFRALKDTTFFEFSTQHKDEDNYRLTKSSQGSHEQWENEIKQVLK